jgi:hypothetical protein
MPGFVGLVGEALTLLLLLLQPPKIESGKHRNPPYQLDSFIVNSGDFQGK